MKKIMIIFFSILVGFTVNTYSSQQDTPLSASVTVASIFNIALDTTSIDFGNVEPGASSGQKTLRLSCTTNNNKPWVVSMATQAPLSFEQYEIPNSNFNWQLNVTRGAGTGAASGNMDTVPFTIYSAGMEDYITEDPVELDLLMRVEIPRGQVAGQYRTILTITMYEQ